jgi:UDP-3-O-[3-hydroxymyristoyl] N-acetylglucosamine deacetylase
MGTDTFFFQRTITRPAAITGVGVHTGKSIQLTLLPAPINTGIVFRRTDAGGVEIPALASHVSNLELATSIGRDDVTISTIEHLMAAAHILGVANMYVEVSGPEVPILDGSARPFLHLLEAAGVVQQPALRRVLAITSPLEVTHEDKAISVSPYPGFRIDYTIDFGHDNPIGRQTVGLEINRATFEKELAGARTFALERDLAALRRAGLGLGGSEDNCVVFGDKGAINTRLRFEREPVRHKALDAVGDLALLGCQMWGRVEVFKGGHLLHYKLIEALQKHPECWTWMQAERPTDELPLTFDHPFLPSYPTATPVS